MKGEHLSPVGRGLTDLDIDLCLWESRPLHSAPTGFRMAPANRQQASVLLDADPAQAVDTGRRFCRLDNHGKIVREMSASEFVRPECIAWARRVNSRWIVHHGLKESADAYMTHLESCDPDRLARSCRCAQELVYRHGTGEDPKPWFYAGLFSLATLQEARTFLAGHWFTAACIPSLKAALAGCLTPDHLGPETLVKLDRIREVLDNASMS